MISDLDLSFREHGHLHMAASGTPISVKAGRICPSCGVPLCSYEPERVFCFTCEHDHPVERAQLFTRWRARRML